MLSTTTQFDTASVASSSNPVAEIFVEHYWNAIAASPVASNAAGGNFDARLPIDSVIRSRIPDSGMPYAIAPEATGFDMSAPTASGNPSVRYRALGDDIIWKYWIGPSPSATGAPFTVASCQPQIDYQEQATSNKVEVVFDVSSAVPTFNIQKRNVGGTWSNIITGATPNATTGRYTAYRQAGGTWSTTRYLDNPDTDFYGIRIVVTNQDSASKYVHVYGFSAILERDFSESITELSISKTRDEADILQPAGRIQTNSLDVSFLDTDESIMFGTTDPLIDRNTKLVVKLGFDTSGIGGTAKDTVAAGTFFVSEFNYDTASMEVSLNAIDEGKFLQQTFVPDVLYVNQPLQAIAEDILERTGFKPGTFNFNDAVNDYSATGAALYKFPYVWFTNNLTVWEALSEVLRAEQGIFYYDENNAIVITDMEHLDATASVLTLDQDDFSNVQSEFTVEANDIAVEYNLIHPNTIRGPAVYQFDSNGNVTGGAFSRIPLNSALWHAGDIVTVGATTLHANVTSGATEIQIVSGGESAIEYDEGEIRIEGEYITYENKRFSNDLTHIKLDVVERGARNTTAAAHDKVSTLWNTKVVAQSDYAGFSASMTSGASITGGDMVLELYGAATNGPYVQWLKAWPTFADSNNDFDVFGTAITFETPAGGEEMGMAGIFMCENDASSRDGYYFELVDINFVASKDWSIGNVRAYKANNTLTRTGLPTTEDGIRGYYSLIDNGYTYVLEVVRETGGTYSLFVNGTLITSFTDATYSVGRWGVFVRGNTKAKFQYFVADGTSGEIVPSDLKRRISPQRRGWGSRFLIDFIETADYYDEFETIVHEVKTFDVQYNQYPALSSRIINTNIWESLLLEESKTPFRAKFTIENIGNTTAILNGQDDSFIAGQLSDYALVIGGQVAVVDDSQTVHVRDEQLIRKRDRHGFTLTNPWLQNEARAKNIANKIITNFKNPVDFISIDWFPNPALQPGDLITLSYTTKGLPARKYYVIESSITYDGGYSGTLLLRYKEDV